MLSFQLFRVKVYPPLTPTLFFEERSSQDWLRTVLAEKPEAELGRGVTWHVGNVTAVDETSAYLALGKTTSASIAQFDPETKIFTEVQFEDAPFTHVFVEIEHGLVAIAQKPKLAPRTQGIGRQLQKLFNESRTARESGIEFELAAIADPETLVEYISRAHSVTKFWMSFTRPNPVNVEELIHKPLQRMLRESAGDVGEATLKGEDLNKEVLTDVVRSIASTGNDAHAYLREQRDAKPVKKVLLGAAVEVSVEDVDGDEGKIRFVLELRRKFERVRRGDGQ